MNISLLINMKMPTIVGIFIFISRDNFLLSWVEHEKSFITLGPDLGLHCLHMPFFFFRNFGVRNFRTFTVGTNTSYFSKKKSQFRRHLWRTPPEQELVWDLFYEIRLLLTLWHCVYTIHRWCWFVLCFYFLSQLSERKKNIAFTLNTVKP